MTDGIRGCTRSVVPSTIDMKTILAIYFDLLEKISIVGYDERDIINQLIRLETAYSSNIIRKVVNTVSESLVMHAETLLMRAVNTLKKLVVVKLIELGADPLFQNEQGYNLSNFWDETTVYNDKNQTVACDIVRILHTHHINFRDGDIPGIESLAKMAWRRKFIQLANTIATINGFMYVWFAEDTYKSKYGTTTSRPSILGVTKLV